MTRKEKSSVTRKEKSSATGKVFGSIQLRDHPSVSPGGLANLNDLSQKYKILCLCYCK